jgi:hypothetical protein
MHRTQALQASSHVQYYDTCTHVHERPEKDVAPQRRPQQVTWQPLLATEQHIVHSDHDCVYSDTECDDAATRSRAYDAHQAHDTYNCDVARDQAHPQHAHEIVCDVMESVPSAPEPCMQPCMHRGGMSEKSASPVRGSQLMTTGADGLLGQCVRGSQMVTGAGDLLGQCDDKFEGGEENINCNNNIQAADAGLRHDSSLADRYLTDSCTPHVYAAHVTKRKKAQKVEVSDVRGETAERVPAHVDHSGMLHEDRVGKSKSEPSSCDGANTGAHVHAAKQQHRSCLKSTIKEHSPTKKNTKFYEDDDREHTQSVRGSKAGVYASDDDLCSCGHVMSSTLTYSQGHRSGGSEESLHMNGANQSGGGARIKCSSAVDAHQDHVTSTSDAGSCANGHMDTYMCANGHMHTVDASIRRRGIKHACEDEAATASESDGWSNDEDDCACAQHMMRHILYLPISADMPDERLQETAR